MTPMLTSVSVTDFRSLKGTVTIPLDAPVVLLHGPNGAGKTSLLSAIELALTGDVPAMRRMDAAYQAHLVHRGAASGRIGLSAVGLPADLALAAELTIGQSDIEGKPLLTEEHSRFFSERCYLAQSTLGRLLEIYQDAKPREESSLTRFVKDLLSLDQLDALIDGLQPVGDIRNLRRLVPEYGDAERDRDAANVSLAEKTENLGVISSAVARFGSELSATVALLRGKPPSASVTTDEIEAVLSDEAEEPQLAVLANQRRDLANLRQREQTAMTSNNAAQLSHAEQEESAASEARKQWSETAGSLLETVIEQLRQMFPELPSVASTDPSLAHKNALSRVEAEILRCNGAIAADDALVVQLEQLAQEIEKSRARILIVDEQITGIAGVAEGLSQALAALIPHIHDEECPVCNRDFSETSKQPLVQHVSGQVARLTEQASKLQGLTSTRLEAANDLTRVERMRDAATARRLSPEIRNQHKARIATLTHSKAQLDQLALAAIAGGDLIRRQSEARRRLSELRTRDRAAVETRSAADELCTLLRLHPIGDAEPTIDVITRLQSHIEARHRSLTERQDQRRKAKESLRELRMLEKKGADLRRALEMDTRTKTRCEASIAAADAKRQVVRNVARAAADARAAIVGKVFNSALNKIWRDLFVRLAPTEPYVPMFRLPRTASEPVAAQLETVHRDGGAGGAPGSMLSAGNLNTAALTLFLALHLSVQPRLPWLILDDPVQSMDEVHIAQFAALLRTLSKEHGRQVIIAVHERPLFDYLALELSPAFDNDRLITVELSRAGGGASFAEPTYRNWTPDKAFAA